jgi:hypothetical protein
VSAVHAGDAAGRDTARSGPDRSVGVELSLSVEDDLLVLARLAVSAVASRAGFDIEEIEDLRLAVDELCLLVQQGRRTGRLVLTMATEPGCIEVWCHYEGADAAVGGAADEEVELSERILDALVDEHGPSARAGRPGAHLVKRRALTDG